jgi:hypothetical protein
MNKLDISILKKKNFEPIDFIASTTAKKYNIDNNIYDPAILKNLERTANKAQEIRNLLKTPVKINSGYRCLELNRKVNGKDTSQHTKGQAIDFYCPNLIDNKFIILLLQELNLEVDQCLMEGSWIHLSIKETGNRNQFAYYLPDKTGKRKLVILPVRKPKPSPRV